MQLTKWDPYREIEDWFDRFNRGLNLPGKARQEVLTTGDWAPRVDIVETDKAFSIKVEIPEVKKEDVKVTVDNGILAVRGERKQEKADKTKKFHRVERFYGSFMRSFTLPDNVDGNRIEASFNDGILHLSIPKTEASKPKVVDINIK